MINKIYIKYNNLGFIAENMGPGEKKNTSIYPNVLILTRKAKVLSAKSQKTLAH